LPNTVGSSFGGSANVIVVIGADSTNSFPYSFDGTYSRFGVINGVPLVTHGDQPGRIPGQATTDGRIWSGYDRLLLTPNYFSIDYHVDARLWPDAQGHLSASFSNLLQVSYASPLLDPGEGGGQDPLTFELLGQLVAVTLPDGTPIAVTFDSGMRLDPQTNTPPEAQEDTITLVEDTTFTGTFQATDADGDALTFRVVSAP
jgi:hypothetical protein